MKSMLIFFVFLLLSISMAFAVTDKASKTSKNTSPNLHIMDKKEKEEFRKKRDFTSTKEKKKRSGEAQENPASLVPKEY